MKKRWLSYIIAFLLIITLNFAVPRLLPGDPLSVIYGDEVLLNLSDGAKDYINEAYGLDKPVLTQYFIYIISIFKGNLGYSYYHKKPVIDILISRIPYSLLLMGLSMFIAGISGIILGIESGWRRGKKIDRFILSTVIFSSSFPGFFVGVVFLIIFGVTLGILPFQGAREAYSGLSGLRLSLDFLRHLILPLVSLVIVFIPTSYLLTRSSMISNIREPFVLLASAKGLSDKRIRYMHAGKNSLIPVATQAGVHLGTRLITGALFIEIVFSYPGMGSLIYNSILNRDYPVLQGSLLIVTLLVLIINFLIDIFYVRLDPRINYAY
ncbi:MAG: ABC transporter permease [Actinomycetota bacterium]|nr:ABC transporter permease [Actinomycetota bacterium]